MYWNEDLLRNNGIIEAPRTWDEITRVVDSVVTFSPTGQIIQTALPFGSFENVKSAKPSLVSLLLQANNPITTLTQTGLASALNQSSSGGLVGAQYALNFFTEFADPYKSLYSWNTSLPDAESMFVSGNLALYPAFASEATSLLQKNPNIIIRMSQFPQAQGSNKAVYARFYGVSVARSAGDLYASAVQGSELLAGEAFSKALADSLMIAPARKSLFSSVTETDSAINQRVVYDSAVVSKTWKDPNPSATRAIFSRMAHNVVSGISRATEALTNAHFELNNLVR
jgi:hypothetical protein